MALVGVAPATMRPTALALNILVAAIVTARFQLSGHVAWRAVVPFVIASVPAAFIGGTLVLPSNIYKPVVGIVLIVAAIQLFRRARQAGMVEQPPTNVPLLPALFAGGAIGLLAGLTGTGGGIFLTPLIILAGWSGARTAAGISAAFILANSISGLAGNLTSLGTLPAQLPVLLAVVGVGALVGSELGARRLNLPNLRRALALVLVIAGMKLIVLG